MRDGYSRRYVYEHVNVVFNAANAIQYTVVSLDDASDKSIHILAMIGTDGHLSIFSVDDDVMK